MIHYLRTLFVNTPGTRLILEVDSVKALHDERAPRRLPLIAIDTIVATSGVDVSTPLLIRCAEDGRTVAFISKYGGARAVVTGDEAGRGALRLHQYKRHLDAGARDSMAAAFVAGKVRQMEWALRQWARDADQARSARLRATADELRTARETLEGASRAQALGVEGAATRKYFSGLSAALTSEEFPGRVRRPPTDPVNTVLSFLYGMLRLEVRGAVHAAGLDAACGYLHGDRDSQPSLVLDLMEEFRPERDRLAVTLFNRRQLQSQHFARSVSGAVSLTEDGRALVMDELHKHRYESVQVVGFQEKLPRGVVASVQANTLANALRHGTAYSAHRLKVV